jgi:hypothetical protein
MKITLIALVAASIAAPASPLEKRDVSTLYCRKIAQWNNPGMVKTKTCKKKVLGQKVTYPCGVETKNQAWYFRVKGPATLGDVNINVDGCLRGAEQLVGNAFNIGVDALLGGGYSSLVNAFTDAFGSCIGGGNLGFYDIGVPQKSWWDGGNDDCP